MRQALTEETAQKCGQAAHDSQANHQQARAQHISAVALFYADIHHITQDIGHHNQQDIGADDPDRGNRHPKPVFAEITHQPLPSMQSGAVQRY